VISENRRSFFRNAGLLTGAAFAGRMWAAQAGASSVIVLGGGPVESWGKSHTIAPREIEQYSRPMIAAYKARLATAADRQSAALAVSGWASFAEGIELNAAIDAQVKALAADDFAPRLDKAQALAARLNAAPYRLGIDPELLAQQFTASPAKALTALQGRGMFGALNSAASTLLSSTESASPLALARLDVQLKNAIAIAEGTCLGLNLLDTELGLVSFFLGFMPFGVVAAGPIGLVALLLGLFLVIAC
jgi:hypothetical protein